MRAPSQGARASCAEEKDSQELVDACSLFILLALAPAAFAQEQTQEPGRSTVATDTVVPQPVLSAGKLAMRAGQTVVATSFQYCHWPGLCFNQIAVLKSLRAKQTKSII